MTYFHDALCGWGFPWCAGENVPEGEKASIECSFFQDGASCECGTCGMMTTETVGVENAQGAMVFRKCVLIDMDELHKSHARQVPHDTNEVA